MSPTKKHTVPVSGSLPNHTASSFTDFYQYIPHAMLVISSMGIIVAANKAAEQLYGGARNEIETMPFTDFLSPVTRAALLKKFALHLQGKIDAGAYRTELLNKKGQILPILINASLIQYEGKPADLLFIQNISTQVQAENAIKTLVTSTVGRVGEDFFKHAVTSIAEWLQVDTVMIGRVEGEYIYAHALLHKGMLLENTCFKYNDSPCHVALKEGFCFFPENVRTLFPRAEHLATYASEAFVGVAVKDRTSDNALGLICVSSQKKISPPPQLQHVLEVIAAKVATELLRLETAATLLESQEHIQQVSDNLQDALWLYDLAADSFVFVSSAYKKIWGLSPEILLNNRNAWLRAIHPDDRARALEAFQNDRQGHATSLEYRVVQPHGAIRWVNSRSFPITDSTGTVYRMVGIAKDITSRKKNEEELAQYRTELEKLVVMRTRELSRREQALESVYAISTSPSTSFNEICDEMVKALVYLLNIAHVRVQIIHGGSFVTQAAISGEISTSDSPEHAICGPCKEVCNKGEVVQLQGALSDDFPESVCVASSSFQSYIGVPIKDDSGAVIALISAMDSTKRTFVDTDIQLLEIFARYLGYKMENIRLEKEIHKAREDELYTKLTSGVAHEVRNPLNAILAVTEVLSMELGETEEYKEYIDLIRGQVDRLSLLMRDLLDLGKPLQLNNVVPISVNVLLGMALHKWQESTLARHHKVVYKSGFDDAILVNVDNTRIQQIATNLLENAAQHSPAGSTIYVSCRKKMNTIVIEICDQGRGVKVEHLKKIFDPFFTTRKGGSGLGMSIVRHFLTLHKGTVSIANNSMAPGCTVRILLPRFKGSV